MSLTNPQVVPADTNATVWRMQMNAFFAMTPEQRIAIWEETQKQLAIMEDAAMRRLHPDFTNLQILVELVRARYGDELASKMINDSSATLV